MPVDELINRQKQRIIEGHKMDGEDYKKRKSAETLPMQNAPAHTPKVGVGQTSNSSLTEPTGKVKGNPKNLMSDRDIDSVINQSMTMEEENLYDDRDDSYDFPKEFTDKTLDSFGIKKLNDSIHIQRRVLATLIDEKFFTDTANRRRMDVNEESGLVIETNKSGIDETFSFNNFVRLGKFKKIAKLATIRELPNIIKNGHIVADNVANKYDSADKNKKFAYIESSIEVDGKEIVVKLAIKKSPQKNKFWLHSIYTTENVSDSPASTLIDTEAGHITADTKNNVTHDTKTVNLFSERDSDSVSNRSLLANSLESSAQNDIERNKLKEYKNKISFVTDKYQYSRNNIKIILDFWFGLLYNLQSGNLPV